MPDNASVRTEHYDYRIMVRAPGRRKWEYQSRVGAGGRDPERLRVKIAREHERSPGWRFKIERRKIVTFKWEWEDHEP